MCQSQGDVGIKDTQKERKFTKDKESGPLNEKKRDEYSFFNNTELRHFKLPSSSKL